MIFDKQLDPNNFFRIIVSDMKKGRGRPKGSTNFEISNKKTCVSGQNSQQKGSLPNVEGCVVLEFQHTKLYIGICITSCITMQCRDVYCIC